MPSLSVAAFIAEGLKAFVETFPQTEPLLVDSEQKQIENYRGICMAKRVFILGAGSSVHGGAPLMNKFLDKAHDLYPRIRDQRWIDAADLVFKAISALQRVHSKSELNLFNLESLFTTFEMAATPRVSSRSFGRRDLEASRSAPNGDRVHSRLFDELSRQPDRRLYSVCPLSSA